jgi:alginate O-acetyltransferase complex protein AlgI
LIAWVLFRAETFHGAWNYIIELFSFNFDTDDLLAFHTILNKEYLLYLIIGAVGAFGTFKGIEKLFLTPKYRVISFSAVFVFIVVAFLLSTSSLVNNLYNPFIYFRF